MAFTPFGYDVLVHSKLGDDPNVDNNLTADEIKALFDAPMVAFKEYINDVLIPALDSFSPESSVAVFISVEKPRYSPCLWYKPTGNGYSVSFIDKTGKETQLPYPSQEIHVGTADIDDNAVTEDKLADNAVTPDKLDRPYFASRAEMILTSGVHYGDSLPATGTTGQLFFKKV